MKTKSPTLPSYSEARELILKQASARITSEAESLPNCINRVLSCDIFADCDYPGADNSSMDGYCLKASVIADASRSNPVILPVKDEIDAGHTIKELPDGFCAYIATGASIPPGADSIVKIEDVTTSENGSVVFSAPVKMRNYIRTAGSELRKGQKIISAGTVISPFVAGQLASAGKNICQVARKPVVAVLTSGDELVMPFEIPRPWQVRNANSTMLVAQINNAGAKAIDAGIARDTGNHATELFLQAAENADIIVTSGGISMGKKDPFKHVFKELSIDPTVYGIAMKPGKPLFFGLYNGKPVFGLPGNQVSSAVTCELFVLPFIRKMLGIAELYKEFELTLAEDSFNDAGRDFFKRGRVMYKGGQTLVRHAESQESHMLSSLAGAELLFLHPANPEKLAAGTRVLCLPLK